MYKIRFHLGRGEHYMKWQVRNSDNSVVSYFDPEKFFFRLHNCKLINKKKIAEKIHCGANKSVCAWIECENLEVIEEQYFNLKIEPDQYSCIAFNPKVKPYWHLSDYKNIDNTEYDMLLTHKKNILFKEKTLTKKKNMVK